MGWGKASQPTVSASQLADSRSVPWGSHFPPKEPLLVITGKAFPGSSPLQFSSFGLTRHMCLPSVSLSPCGWCVCLGDGVASKPGPLPLSYTLRPLVLSCTLVSVGFSAKGATEPFTAPICHISSFLKSTDVLSLL